MKKRDGERILGQVAINAAASKLEQSKTLKLFALTFKRNSIQKLFLLTEGY